jgi:hypothetical protein
LIALDIINFHFPFFDSYHKIHSALPDPVSSCRDIQKGPRQDQRPPPMMRFYPLAKAKMFVTLPLECLGGILDTGGGVPGLPSS